MAWGFFQGQGRRLMIIRSAPGGGRRLDAAGGDGPAVARARGRSIRDAGLQAGQGLADDLGVLTPTGWAVLCGQAGAGDDGQCGVQDGYRLRDSPVSMRGRGAGGEAPGAFTGTTASGESSRPAADVMPEGQAGRHGNRPSWVVVLLEQGDPMSAAVRVAAASGLAKTLPIGDDHRPAVM